MKLPIFLQRISIAVLVCFAITLSYGKPIYYIPDSAAKLDLQTREKIDDIAALLKDTPGGFAVSIEQRGFWDRMAQSDTGKKIIARAESIASESFPALTDELYLQFSKDGSRTAAQRVMSIQQKRLALLCLAECLENNGRFINPLEEVLDALISYKTWVYPAHDPSLANFHQKTITLDLRSTINAHHFALCLSVLGGHIDPALAEKARNKIHKMVLAPYCSDIFDNTHSSYWKTSTNNWNPVCHAGVVGAALSLLEDKQDRALFIERAMYYTDYYYNGFTPDGYCSEGLGYWNYGYGNYIELSELIYGATEGKIDLFKNPKGLPAALYPFRLEIMNHCYPTLADCQPNTSPSPNLMGYVNKRLGLNDSHWTASWSLDQKNMVNFLMWSQMDLNRPVIIPPFGSDYDQLRTWFSDAGVLICRPSKNSNNDFAVVLKGGHNGEHHNHNDVGSFIVLVGDQQVITDPGSPEYTAKTFSKDRYTIAKIASYGHSVPLIGGTQQISGSSAKAKIIRKEFSNDTDVLGMDLSSAYPVKGLEKLQRTFVYQRKGTGALKVTDEFAFDTPNTFETALITYGTCKIIGPGRLEVTSKGETVDIRIESDDNDIEIEDRPVGSSRGDFRRIAVRFIKPVKNGEISMHILPKER